MIGLPTGRAAFCKTLYTISSSPNKSRTLGLLHLQKKVVMNSGGDAGCKIKQRFSNDWIFRSSAD